MKSELTPLAQIELSIEIMKFSSLFLHDIKLPPEWVLEVIILSRKIGYESDINYTVLSETSLRQDYCAIQSDLISLFLKS